MTKIIANSFKNARCKKCDRRFAVGEDVRWTKGDGAECITCPAQTEMPTQPTTQRQAISLVELGETITKLARERDAALSDGQALRRRIGEQETEIKQLKAKLATSEEVRLAVVAHVQQLMDENEQLRRELRMSAPVLMSEPCDDPSIEDDASPHPYSDAGYEHDLDDCAL